MTRRTGLGAVIAGLAGLTACNTTEPARAPAPAPAARAVAAAPAPAPVAAPDLSLGDGFVMSDAIVDDRVTLIPILALAPPTDTANYLLLSDGMDRGKVTVREMPEDWIVETVQVHNRSLQPVLAMRGEVLLDGNQDRVVAQTVILAAGERTELSVRCVEAERERGTTKYLRPGGVIAELALRRTVRWNEQHAVWKMVDTINDRQGLSPSTETYRHAAARQLTGLALARRDRVLARLAAAPGRATMVGVAVALDGKVLAIEQFASPALYQAVEPRLIASYLAVTDVDPTTRVTGHRTVTPQSVRALAGWTDAATVNSAATEILRPIDPTPQD